MDDEEKDDVSLFFDTLPKDDVSLFFDKLHVDLWVSDPAAGSCRISLNNAVTSFIMGRSSARLLVQSKDIPNACSISCICVSG